jgi:hypothetical protein
MKIALRWTCLLTLLAACIAAPASAGEHRLGFRPALLAERRAARRRLSGVRGPGRRRLRSVSYQYLAGFIRFEVAAEYFDKGFQGSLDWAVSPQVYILAGRGIYGGLGVGATYSDFANGSWSDPYYIAKAGFDLLLLPKIHLDINADYRFLEWEDLDNYDSDTITFGATVRVAF